MLQPDSVPAGRAGIRSWAGDEVAELVMEASRFFETDRSKARSCIQRAARLVIQKREGGPLRFEPLVVQGGLSVWQMEKLMAYIESNIGCKILAVQLAAHVHVSLGHFFRAFRRSFGMPPHTYVMRRRILRAEVLMATSEVSLARIAIDCGLSDQAHLSRTFRRIVGVTPKMWRRTAGGRPNNSSTQISR
jgi:transcriptional regulator GlxA family with amidase domain